MEQCPVIGRTLQSLFLMTFCSRQLAEQAEDLEDMYTKRMELYRKSVKKENNRKRRRRDGI